jgi:hypothetical protein
MRFFSTIAPWPATVLLMMVAGPALPQTGESPYSAYGLGTLVGNTQVPQLLMGGVAYALPDPAGISPANPASYTGLRKTAIEGGIAGGRVRYSSGEYEDTRNNSALLGFTLGIPWNNGRWALALGLLPVSSVNYRVDDRAPLSNGDEVILRYQGTGGLSRGFVGLARTIWQQRPDSLGHLRGRLSLGVNYNYLFGTVEQTRLAVYPLGSNYTNFASYTGLVLRGGAVNMGLHYGGQLVSVERMERRRRLKDQERKAAHQAWLEAHPDEEGRAPRPYRAPAVPWRFLIGLGSELPADLGAKRNLLETTFLIANGVDFVQDTVRYVDGQRGNLVIPPSYGAGVAVTGERWTITGDVRWRDWGALRLDVEDYSLNADLRRSTTYAFGASFRPAYERDREYLKRVIYRAGVRYTSDYLRVQDVQLDELAVSGGFSLPISEGNYLSRVHLGAVVGRRGDPAAQTLQEGFLNLYLGLTLTPNLRERWFAPTRIE